MDMKSKLYVPHLFFFLSKGLFILSKFPQFFFFPILFLSPLVNYGGFQELYLTDKRKRNSNSVEPLWWESWLYNSGGNLISTYWVGRTHSQAGMASEGGNCKNVCGNFLCESLKQNDYTFITGTTMRQSLGSKARFN